MYLNLLIIRCTVSHYRRRKMKKIIKILYAEDEKGYSSAIPQYFDSKKIDYQFDFATTKNEALNYLETNSCDYDLIIVDLKFQQEDLAGLEIFRYLSAKSIEIPSIIVTAYANAKNLFECIKERPYKLLKKPFTQRELRDAVKSVLKEAAKKNVRPHLSIARKLINQLPNTNKIKIIIEALESLTPEQYDEIVMELPMIQATIEEENKYRYSEEEEIEEKWKKEGGKIPRSIIDKAKLFLEYKLRKLASGKSKNYGPFLYLRWMDKGKLQQHYVGKLEKVTDPDLIEKLYKRYQNDEYFKRDDKLNTIPILYQNHCTKSL